MQKIISLLESSSYDIRRHNDSYAIVNCKKCGKDAFVGFRDQTTSIRIQCNHRNNCNHHEVIPLKFTPDELELLRIERQKSKEQYLEDHGIDYKSMVEKGILGEDFSILLGKGVRMNMGQRGLKWTWYGPDRKKWNAEEDGDYLPSLNTGGDTIYIVEGVSDWLLATQDGLCCTTSMFGADRVPKSNVGWGILNSKQTIVICYDNDNAGVTARHKLIMSILEKFPRKNVELLRYPFRENEEGKDYCDWRLRNTLEDFLALPRQVQTIEKLTKEKQREDALSRALDISAQSDEVGEEVKVVKGRDAIWLVGKNKLWKKSQIIIKGFETGQWKTKEVLPQGLEVAALYRDLFEDDTTVQISVDGRKLKEIFSMEEVLHTNKCSRLATKGLKISTKNKMDVIEYLEDVIAETPFRQKADRNGWVDRERFILGEKEVTPQGTYEIKSGARVYAPRCSGDEKEWREAVEHFAKVDPQVSVALGAGAVSPALEAMGASSFVLHFHQQSSRGKSFGNEIASSLWGSPEKLMAQWRASQVGVEVMFQEAGGLPCFLEESQKAASPKFVEEVTYFFSNETGKLRGAPKAGGGAKAAEMMTWKGVLLSTGEYSISGTTVDGGGRARTVEVLRKPPEISEKYGELVKAAQDSIKENYGFMGPKILQYIMENRPQLKKDHEELRSLIKSKLANLNELQGRGLSHLASIAVGCRILRRIGLDIASEEAVIEQLIGTVGDSDKRTSVEKAQMHLDSLFGMNANKFAESSMHTVVGECWGRVDYKKEVVYWFPHILQEKLIDAGFLPSIITMMEAQGLAEPNKAAKIFGRTKRLTQIKLSSLEPEPDPDPDPDPEPEPEPEPVPVDTHQEFGEICEGDRAAWELPPPPL